MDENRSETVEKIRQITCARNGFCLPNMPRCISCRISVKLDYRKICATCRIVILKDDNLGVKKAFGL